jgi:hypothetical protein
MDKIRISSQRLVEVLNTEFKRNVYNGLGAGKSQTDGETGGRHPREANFLLCTEREAIPVTGRGGP